MQYSIHFEESKKLNKFVYVYDLVNLLKSVYAHMFSGSVLAPVELSHSGSLEYAVDQC